MKNLNKSFKSLFSKDITTKNVATKAANINNNLSKNSINFVFEIETKEERLNNRCNKYQFIA